MADSVKRNIELKARCLDLEEAHRVALRIGATLYAVERQRDTYFHAGHGRLKLRERWRVRDDTVEQDASGAPGQALTSQLIWYQRADDARPRASNYLLVEVENGEQLCKLLTQAIGVLLQVLKQRAVYLHENVRIHLDQVDGLGNFVEFEAIVDATCDEAAARAKLTRLRGAFDITDDQLVSQSYSDLTGPD